MDWPPRLSFSHSRAARGAGGEFLCGSSCYAAAIRAVSANLRPSNLSELLCDPCRAPLLTYEAFPPRLGPEVESAFTLTGGTKYRFALPATYPASARTSAIASFARIFVAANQKNRADPRTRYRGSELPVGFRWPCPNQPLGAMLGRSYSVLP